MKSEDKMRKIVILSLILVFVLPLAIAVLFHIRLVRFSA